MLEPLEHSNFSSGGFKAPGNSKRNMHTYGILICILCARTIYAYNEMVFSIMEIIFHVVIIYALIDKFAGDVYDDMYVFSWTL